MLPVIAIVGRPNVGKSTLFNRLTKTQDALVLDMPGVTRDRLYGEGRVGDKPYIIVDTGGIGEEALEIDGLMSSQSWQAISEADYVLFMIDGRAGVMGSDSEVAARLRQVGKPTILVVNKMDGVDQATALAESYRLGFSDVSFIAASHGHGVTSLAEKVLAHFPAPEPDEESAALGIRLAIVGRPNVGKSTLVNRILGEERVVVCDFPGTTRDSIRIPLLRHGTQYTLIDTAGVRRRARISENLEKFSVIKTLQAIKEAQVVALLFDATEGVTDQDLQLLRFVCDAGKALVLAINKWDGLTDEHKNAIKNDIERRLQFVDFARIHFISALHGTGVGTLFTSVREAYTAAMRQLSTPELTRILERAVRQHEPPMTHGRRIKLRYAHAGGQNPPLIVIHGNQTDSIPDMYVRYLVNYYRERLKLVGTPLRIEFKTGVNPFQGHKNKLTVSQERKRKRLIKHVKAQKR